MYLKITRLALTFLSGLILPAAAMAQSSKKDITINASGIQMVLNYDHQASITSLTVGGQTVISGAGGVFTSVTMDGTVYSSQHLNTSPVLLKTKNTIKLNGIQYGPVTENWTFTISSQNIKWRIERSNTKALKVDEAAFPAFNFDNINTWEGAYQGYGGLAWFYLFNEKLCTYGIHTRSSDFWNSKNNTGLNITVDAPGKNVCMKYSRTNGDKLAYTIGVSDKEMQYKMDTGTNRRRFIRQRTDVWAPYIIPAGKSYQTIKLSYFNFNQKYGRGKLKGIDSTAVSAVLNTIARIGVIDSLHFGGNSWHTPYGPICLHEQYIGQLGLGINDPKYLKGYQSCLDFYRDHAIKPDGRVYPRWAYTNEDAMPGKFNQYGFYEAQWGILMDSNPDLVTNVAELYDMSGDKTWVKTHQLSCEKALDWILKRDSNHNGLVEMMTNDQSEKKSSDWIDIIWASYENAFVNAKLYHALVKWAAIERLLNNNTKAGYYEDFAARLKTSFNKSTKDGGFWDEEKGCYVHWIAKDKTVHGTNMVTPVNFMAIAYGICDDGARRKTILDNIETQMQQEKLFFWPIAMTTYAPGEGNGWQFPFPNYENGDLFLSWGSIGVKAYAAYSPALALKYVKNVLNQYSKDGLAFQRYGRLKQDGLGDDILSGNSLAIVGLYQAIYGINPEYNRLYLDPHITPELEGTSLNYRFRNERLVVNLEHDKYAVSNSRFKMVAQTDFGFFATKTRLSYFNGNNANAALQITSAKPLTIEIKNWDASKMEWLQTSAPSSSPVTYTVHQLKPNSAYTYSVDGNFVKSIQSNTSGDLVISRKSSAGTKLITISSKK
ncbi:alpha-L-rhamnosidase-related protein [Mucilaginibacter gotjawali]|uniref:Alpha-L-rhamnosidase six-hairpin glycosidase domain-containing protein n=1 Tax=Mucilaginibacter gotjawali TaxID=1550579 RepID=A0A839SR60_9SPHI|nr:hypothetical protein [Mucilaginibacter gotjawali]MBB3058939.1 hypothetical protein [Mucilaginibacter gotjawali]